MSLHTATETLGRLKGARESRDNLMVWIGKSGCAVRDTRDDAALPVSASMARHFINRAQLVEVERRAEGLLFAAA